MGPSDLPHVRWLVSVVERDEQGQLFIPSGLMKQVESTIHQRLDNPETASAMLDQILRFADAIVKNAQQVDLARALIEILLRHPVGRQRFDQTGGAEWSQFSDREVDHRAPVYDRPRPQDTLPLDAVHNPLSKLR